MADFTTRELDIMNVLWEHGPATVAEVRERLGDELAYTTVLTMLRILEDKGAIDHEQEGRAYRYRPIVERDAARRHAVRRLLDGLFRGSTELLVTQLVRDRDLSEEDVERLREVLDQELDERRS